MFSAMQKMVSRRISLRSGVLDFRLDDGHIELVDRPGPGMDVKEQDVPKLPDDRRMHDRRYRHADGSWQGW